VRVLTERLDHVNSVSLGIWLATGLRNEPPGQEGVNHFLEHMVFKGTHTRSTLEIAEVTDDIGGQVNGFTEREFMYLLARTIGEQVDTALELLFDLLINSICPEEEVTRELEVVLQEIRHVEDTPEEWVHDLLLETAWPNHWLGRQLMGSPKTVRQIGREALLAHLASLRYADRVIVAAAGQVDHERVVDLASRLAGDLVPGTETDVDGMPHFTAECLRIPRATSQVHFCLGTPGCSQQDRDHYAFGLLDTILGGGASSRLFQEIRENRGLAYSIGSYHQSYRSAGLFAIDAGTGPEDFEFVVDLIGREVARLQRDGPSPAELERARTQLKVAIALAAESTGFRMQHLAVSEIYWGRVLSFDEIVAGVDAVTAEDVYRVVGQTFTPERQALVAIGPF
jgi:predicted Zn-dependent peptidase